MENKNEAAVTDGIFGFDRNLIDTPKKGQEVLKTIQTAVDYLSEKEASSFKMHASTLNDAEQELLERMGFLPTGFLFGVRNNKGTNRRSDKDSLIVYTMANKKKSAGPVYLPKNMSLAEKLYVKLGVSIAVEEPGAPEMLSRINTRSDERNGVFYVRALKCGQDFDKILQILIDECGKHLSGTITMMLNINDPAAVHGYETARKHGFWFSGFDPLSMDFEYILMYYGRGAKLFLNEIATTKTANALLRDVIQA